jgi:Ca2+-binding RTX toxin-like protein
MFYTEPAREYYPLYFTAEETVDSFYRNVLGRAPDAQGKAYWVSRLNATNDIGRVIEEIINAVDSYSGTDPAALTSKALFANKTEVGRYFADKGGNASEAKEILKNVTDDPSSVVAAKAVIDAPDLPLFTLTAGAATVNEGDAAFFTLQTTNVAAGTQYAYAVKGVSGADVAGGVIAGLATVDANGSALIAIPLANDNSTEGDETMTVEIAGKSASVTVKDTSLSPVVPFTLGTAIDNKAFVGNVDDTFNAPLSGGAATLNNLDSLDGGGGNDTLIVELNGVSVTPAKLTSIEQISVLSSVDGSVLDLTNATGLNNLTSIVSSGTLTFNNIQSTATAVAISNTTKNHTINFATAAVSGSADTASVSLSNVTGSADILGLTGIETLAITAAGTNDVDTDYAGVITVNSSGAMTMSGTAGGLAATSVDGTQSTGALTLTVTNAAHTVTGGSGADNITGATATGNSLKGNAGNDTLTGGLLNDTIAGDAGNDSIVAGAGVDSLDGGAGNDTFDLSGNGHLAATDVISGGADTDTLLTTSADAIAYTTPSTRTITGIDVLSLVDSLNGSVTLANIDTTIATVNLAAGAGAPGGTVVGPAGALTVNLAAALGGSLTVTDTGTATTDTLNIVNTAAGNVGAANAVTVNGYETVNINGSGTGTATTQTLSTVTVAADTGGSATVNFTGSNAFSVSGAITAATINASGLTGTATLTMGAAPVGATSVTGTANADTLRGVAAAATTIDGGAGDDNITGGSAADSLVGGTGNDVITGGGGNDVIAGGDGNDNITGGAGNDSISGGLGNDTIASTTGSDTVDGGDGNDAITSTSTTSSTLMGGLGDDTITNTSGGNLNLSGGDGNDTIVRTGALSLTDTIDGGNGSADVLSVNRLDVATIAAGTFGQITAFVNNLSNIERLTVSTGLTNETLDVSMFDSVGYLTLAGTAAGGAVTVSNMVDNSTVILTSDITSALALNYASTTGSQTLNLELASSGGINAAAAAITAAGIETVNLVSNDTDTTTGGNATDTLLLTAAAATSIVVTGDSASLNLTQTGSTALTSLNASAYGGALTTTVVATTGVAVSGGAGNDNITGGTGADSLSGGTGNDTLTGGTGNDTLSGGTGDDVLTGGGGIDVIDGGAGNDTYALGAYETNTSTVGAEGTLTGAVINLSSSALSYAAVNAATGRYISGSLTSVPASSMAFLFNGENTLNIATVETLTSIENATGGTGATPGTNDNDYILGSSDANVIDGGDGADTIVGGGGNDTLTGGAGADSITGGTGVDSFTGGAGVDTIKSGGGDDVISDLNTGNAVDVIVFSGTETKATAVANQTYLGQTFSSNAAGFVQFSEVAGYDPTSNNPALNTSQWTLVEKKAAVQGNATLSAADKVSMFTHGSDSYVYYSGATTAASDDQFLKIESNTTLTSIDDTPTAGFSLASSVVAIASTFTVASSAFTGDNRTTNALTVFNFNGSGTVDALYRPMSTAFWSPIGWAGASASTFTAAAGDTDLIAFLNTNTTLKYSDLYSSTWITSTPTGARTLDENAEVVSMVLAPDAYSSFYGQSGGVGNIHWAMTGGSAADLIFGSMGNDTLNGNAGADFILGGDGNDSITGGVDADTILGGAGNDTINMGTGDKADGGAGDDAFAFAAATAGATVIGGAGADTITLGNFANTLTVSDVDGISITGGSGVDALTFTAAVTATTVVGGGGADTIVLGDFTNALTVNTGTISITGGTGVDALTFTASLSAATVVGGTGADTITLADGGNTLTVNDATVSITGGTGADVLTFTASLSAATVVGGGGADTIALGNFTNAITVGSTGGTVVVTGGTGADTIVITGGASTVTGGAGADVMTGGAGADVFSFSSGHGNTTTTIDEIVNLLTSGADTIKTGVAGNNGVNYAELGLVDNGAGLASLATLVTAADAAFVGLNAGATQFVIAENGTTDAGNGGGGQAATTFSYLIIDWNGDNTADQAIKLTGVTDVTAAGITAALIVA